MLTHLRIAQIGWWYRLQGCALLCEEGLGWTGQCRAWLGMLCARSGQTRPGWMNPHIIKSFWYAFPYRVCTECFMNITMFCNFEEYKRTVKFLLGVNHIMNIWIIKNSNRAKGFSNHNPCQMFYSLGCAVTKKLWYLGMGTLS
jgi:hypothetical protein